MCQGCKHLQCTFSRKKNLVISQSAKQQCPLECQNCQPSFLRYFKKRFLSRFKTNLSYPIEDISKKKCVLKFFRQHWISGETLVVLVLAQHQLSIHLVKAFLSIAQHCLALLSIAEHCLTNKLLRIAYSLILILLALKPLAVLGDKALQPCLILACRTNKHCTWSYKLAIMPTK